MTEHNLPTGPHELELEMLELHPALEAVLMVADQPLDHLTLAQAVGHPPSDVEQALTALADEYTEQGRGFELRNIAGGWRFFTREEYAGAVERFILDGQQARLTQAALETMAVVAYRQPISRSRISAIRGVNVDGVVRTLVTRGLIEEGGVDGESGAVLYRTTSYFLERMGLGSISELPDIAQHLPEMEDMEDEVLAGADDVLATIAGEEPAQGEMDEASTGSTGEVSTGSASSTGEGDDRG
ncbi:SMC-Scp complex subunit ScpB [Aeromicrobium fastidiosum]|uniref:SMC-Scp complex subunit ScpB n=1 Tax=Aeromicrobium fastidiosum TaxID=52699 RepID=A0A641AIH2_9ACTN|nr:SMC-Scp complex subunit ScpB [Aeromicrobium fastidiosum]KAA1372514.1 SMC-Scp complex subunit ScpB [Aeromicrobium fastidiosum]MBP2391401.1 segregation and condensation protein B [Aeromicrobium fastidiosum]